MKPEAFKHIYFDKLEDIRDKGPLGRLGTLVYYDLYYDWHYTFLDASFLNGL